MLFLSWFLLYFRAGLFSDALRSPAGKELTSWLSFTFPMSNCHFPIGILGQMWCLIVSIPDLSPFPTMISMFWIELFLQLFANKTDIHFTKKQTECKVTPDE